MKTLKLHFFFLLLAATSIIACKGKGKTGQEIDYGAQGYLPAMVVDYQVDGCMWMVQTEDGKKYEPMNLPEEFRKDQQKVWVKYELQKNAMTICMAGAVVKIVDMKMRK